jgi:hypothetical protein
MSESPPLRMGRVSHQVDVGNHPMEWRSRGDREIQFGFELSRFKRRRSMITESQE